MTDATTTTEKTVETTAAATTDATAAAAAAAAATTATTDATKAAATAAATIVGDKTAADKTSAVPANFPDNWRELLASGDDKKLNQLKRYSDPQAFAAKAWSLEQRLSSGELKAQLPKDAKPEQVDAFRKDAGLPEKVEGYVEKLALPNGMVLGEADKPIVAEFAQVAYDGQMAPAQFNGLVTKYYAIQDAMKIKEGESDSAHRTEVEDGLRAAWGGDYRANVNSVDNLVARMPDGFASSFLSARVPSPTKDNPGRTVPLGNHPDWIKFAAQWEREINPVSTLVPPGGGDPMKTVEGELEAIRKVRRENYDAYAADKKMQARELELIDAQLKTKARSAA